MQIATWNLARARPGGRRAAALLRHMEAITADVWVLTETWRDFTPGAGYELAATSEVAPDRPASAGERWVAIWTRLPGAAHQPLRTRDNERTAAARLSVPGRRPLVVYGTVLPWLSDARRPVGARGSAGFCAALGLQTADWREIQASEGSPALCVAGDFNQDLAQRHYYGSKQGRTVLRKSITDSGLRCLTAGAPDPVLARGGLASIDHVCVSGGLALRADSPVLAWPEADELGGRLTDHFGVVAALAYTA